MTDITRRLHCTIRCDIETAASGCHCAEARDEITRLRALNAELVNVVNAADDLRIAIRKAGVKRQHPELYVAICAFDSCRAAIAKAERNGYDHNS